jgi:excisionase family DNA binding protein
MAVFICAHLSPSLLIRRKDSILMLDQVSPWRTRAEAAEYARVSESTIDRWVRDRKLTKHFVTGTRSVRFHTDDLDKLMIPDAQVVTVGS